MYDNIVYEDGTVAEKPDLHMYKSSSPDTEDGRVSEEVKEGRGRDEVVMNEGREESREGSKERKKRRFLRRLHKSRDGKD